MVPILGSILVGIAVKVGLGLAASAAKKLLEGASPAIEAKQPESFANLLKTRAAEATPATSPPAEAARLPSDLAGRLAAEERVRSLVLDVQMRHNLAAPPGLLERSPR